MNRRIFFRAKDIDNNQWVYGSYFPHKRVNLCIASEEEYKANIQHLIIQDKPACDWNFDNGMQAIDINPETLGQYTGLEDKNGKMIFEGDIVKGTISSAWGKGDIVCKVEYNRDGFYCYDKRPRDEGWWEHKLMFAKNIEVIGNVWDNPELLGE